MMQPEKTKNTVIKNRALIRDHALSGADITGSMSGKGKISCWQAFNSAKYAVHEAFGKLQQASLEDRTKNALEQYVSFFYQPDTSIVHLNETRWWMFCRKQAKSNKLPQTELLFRKAIQDKIPVSM